MSTATPMLCAHCGRPMQSFVQVGSFWYHPECAQSPYAAPQPAEQPEYGSISERAQAWLEAGLWKPEPAEQPEPNVCARCGGLAYDPLLVQQPEPSCGWAGCPHGAECVHAKQPEPGGLTEDRIIALGGDYAANGRWPSDWIDFARAVEREVRATTHKRSDEEVARIMEAADKYAKYHRVAASTDGSIVSRAARAEVERLLRGEA